jgi:alpha-galactosidase/6-phospho-beta-glucosidase family protein
LLCGKFTAAIGCPKQYERQYSGNGVRGIFEKNKTKILQAILLDPLTLAMLTIDETRNMVDELFHTEKDYLKGYK